ncbi:MAG: bifunctional alpha,alpha-trehalose-phosphate synthase (UDP-forming)/trehalose-phosphatase [Leptospirales bacterium]|nr:bifunctional alpha,alpha-trehalose-phosphate synthase (UDP-forming)/trehalose-phosphatase [Leptospirales bacterium]
MRYLIVSNRLPFSIQRAGAEFRLTPSVGGLATGIRAFLAGRPEAGRLWIGWPGLELDGENQLRFDALLRREHDAAPVFLTEAQMRDFYHGFCNSTLWALFHYFPSYAVYDAEFYEEYRRVNQIYAEAILAELGEDDLLWIHDYQLMLVPGMIRQRRPAARIGFFLHIPFPEFELFRLLPRQWRSDLISGVLGADLIGFHTHDYARYFLRSALRILGVESEAGRLLYGDRAVKVDAFPMGIDFERFFHSDRSSDSLREEQRLSEARADRRWILSIDRLDYSKGIAHRLRAFERFLQERSDWIGRVSLIVVVVPSRVEVDQYQLLKSEIDELVGAINGRFSRPDWTPITYLFKTYDFDMLTALYRQADVALITPLRDGMNLIAKEYVAARADGAGVLALSEMAGAAQELGEALLVNPNDIVGMAQTIADALEMPLDEQRARMRRMQSRIRRYDVFRWADEFMSALEAWQGEQRQLEIRPLRGAARHSLLQAWRGARRRLLLTDYDGTLAPFHSMPELAHPSEEIRSLLLQIAQQCQLVIISGRDRETLQRWLGDLPLTLIAEHGAATRLQGEEWRELQMAGADWKSVVRPVFDLAADRTPGAFVEEKEFSLVWHFRNADLEAARAREQELLDTLTALTANLEVQILRGNRIVEARMLGANKGAAALRMMAREDYDWILAIGDDATDEDMFQSLPPECWTVRVGLHATRARFNLDSQSDVPPFFSELAAAAQGAWI